MGKVGKINGAPPAGPHVPPTQRGYKGTIPLTKRQVGQGIKSGFYTSGVAHSAKKEIPQYSTGKAKDQNKRERQHRGPPTRSHPQ